MQSPPAFSAVKVGGVPSYKLARQGKAETLKPRPVTIFELELTAYDDPFVNLRVRCSKGVYIRTLCADLGEVLGPGAHLAGLTRTRSGLFTLDHAVTLGKLADMAASGGFDTVMVSVDDALAAIPSIIVEDAAADKIIHGGRIPVPRPAVTGNNGPVRIHDRSGKLLALARTGEEGLLPETVFSQPV